MHRLKCAQAHAQVFFLVAPTNNTLSMLSAPGHEASIRDSGVRVDTGEQGPGQDSEGIALNDSAAE